MDTYNVVRHLARVRPEQLDEGGLRDLHAIYGGLGSGRLVIVGAPGSGKTGAAALLVLAALEHREQVPGKDRPQVPVPVLVTLHGWDPETQDVQAWLVRRLQRDYRLFAGEGGAAQAAELVRTGRIAVLLDGLDEIPSGCGQSPSMPSAGKMPSVSSFWPAAMKWQMQSSTACWRTPSRSNCRTLIP
jgi:hypothetical protein